MKRTTKTTLERMRAEWMKAGETLFAGPRLPSRVEVYDAAIGVVIRALWADGAASITEVAELCSASRRAIRVVMQRLGILERGKARPPHLGTDWAAEPELFTASIATLAARHGVGHDAVYQARRRIRARKEAA